MAMAQGNVDAAAGNPQAQDALAYEMVVALLEYQLSSPVQWCAPLPDHGIPMVHID